MEAALQEVAPYINELTNDNPSSADDAQTKTKLAAILKLLIEKDLAYVSFVFPKKMGCHMRNRYGIGLDPCDVHDLLAQILLDGFVLSETKNAVAFEVNPQDDTQWLFNDHLAKSSNGMLRPLLKEDMSFVSVSCSHTNGGLNAIDYKCSTTVEAAATNGKLAIEKVNAINPPYAAAVSSGLEWTIIRWQVEHHCPHLADFIQAAANRGHNTRRVTTDVQALMQMHRLGARNMQVQHAFMWDLVARHVEGQHSHLRGHARDMCSFVEKWSGGSDAPLLRNLDEWCKTLQSRRCVPGSAFKVLANLDLISCPETIYSLLKAAIKSPAKFVTPGTNMSRLINGSDCNALATKQRGLCIQLSTMIKAATAWFGDHAQKTDPSLKRSVFVQELGAMEVNGVMMMMKKAAPGVQAYTSLEAVGADFLARIYELAPKTKDLEPPFSPEKPQPKKKGGSPDGSTGFTELADGIDGGRLKQLGLIKGATVSLKTPLEKGEGDKYIIKCIVGSQVRLLSESDVEKADGKKPPVMKSKSKKRGKCGDDEADEDDIEDGTDGSIKISTGDLVDLYKDHAEMSLMATQAQLRLALMHAYRIASKSVNLQVTYAVDPKVEVHKVIAMKKYEKNQLFLIPLSLWCHVGPTNKMPANAVVVKDFPHVPSHCSAYVLPCVFYPEQRALKKDPLVIPFWNVPATDSKSDVNMTPCTIRIEVQRTTLGLAKDGVCKIEVPIPALWNTKPIQQGAKLYRQRAEAATTSKESASPSGSSSKK
ncbi:unnamed protein product [Prorocentrum cordatum]|uniref:Uncharacterized protein n=1 Tax=Prorocentrum cordatum TaxID=2364126 RepID=A0ABN9S285_9DINO|nr:unnamed protein product [Polarella glacialis]